MAFTVTVPLRPVHGVANAVQEVLGTIDNSLERGIARLAGVPETSDAPRKLNDPSPASRLDADIERPYKRDTRWAVPLMWWEMAFGAYGAGTFAVSACRGNLPGMAFGWLNGTVGKGLPLLLDLGRPERLWRVFAKPGTSWIARGSYAFVIFAGSGASAIACEQMGWKRAATASKVVAVAASGVLATYDGKFLGQSSAVSGWQTAPLPFAFGADALKTGSLLAGALCAPRLPQIALTVASAASSALIFRQHLADLESSQDPAARLTRVELLGGRQKTNFVTAGMILGTAVPAALAVVGSKSRLARVAGAGLAAVGTLLTRKAVLKSGIHSPII